MLKYLALLTLVWLSFSFEKCQHESCFDLITQSSFMFAGKAAVCEILLENQADVDHADKEGKSALFAAASMGHLDIVNILLFWGCYADGIDCEGRTVLSVAAAEGSAGVVQVGECSDIIRCCKCSF